MKHIILFSLFLLTSCYSSLYLSDRHTGSIQAITSSGDTLTVNIHSTYSLYDRNRIYYQDWKFYYNGGWVSTPYYYDRYYIPYYIYRDRPTYYYPQPGIPIYYKPKKSYDKRESKPRSTGTTSAKKSRNAPEGKKRTRSSEKKKKG